MRASAFACDHPCWYTAAMQELLHWWMQWLRSRFSVSIISWLQSRASTAAAAVAAGQPSHASVSLAFAETTLPLAAGPSINCILEAVNVAAVVQDDVDDDDAAGVDARSTFGPVRAASTSASSV